MSTENHNTSRALQQDVRAWAKLTGSNYTTALRQMKSPLAQGILGERVSARHLIATLESHPLVGDESYRLEDSGDGFVRMALTVEALRIFTPEPEPAVGSYSLKHTIEKFMTPVLDYVSNGQIIWAAAALDLPMSVVEPGSINRDIGVSERQHRYMQNLMDRTRTVSANHYRPPGYLGLMDALAKYGNGEPFGVVAQMEEASAVLSDFHTWMVAQERGDDDRGHLLEDYLHGVENSEHRMVSNADDLAELLVEFGASEYATAAANDLGREFESGR